MASTLFPFEFQILASELEPGLIFPDYRGASLANLPDSLCRWLGVPMIQNSPLAANYLYADQQFDQVVLLVVDGLGWNMLQKWVKSDPERFGLWNDKQSSGQCASISTIVPSTTCAVLTTLNTGVLPAIHGNLAYELWLKEYGIVANMISHLPVSGGSKIHELREKEFLPVGTLDAHLGSHGIHTSALQPASISRSSLTSMLFPNSEINGYHSMGDLWFRLEKILNSPHQLPGYYFVYWGDIDLLSHLYGPDDIRVQMAFRDFTQYFSGLISTVSGKTTYKRLLVVTSDHGIISTPKRTDLDLRNHPDLLNCLAINPTGENRLAFFHCKPGKEDNVKKYFEKSWREEFDIVSSEILFRSGILGEATNDPKVRNRLGDLVIIPRGNAYLWWGNKENRLLGRHGGLSSDEMLVPILIIEF